MNVIVQQPGSLPSFAYQEMAEGARFENPEALETIGPDSPHCFNLNHLR